MEIKDFFEVLRPVLKKLKEKKVWENILKKNGEEILNREHDLDSEIFSQLAVLFSEENSKGLSKITGKTSGYDIEERIRSELKKFFNGYTIEQASRDTYIEEYISMLKEEIKQKKPDMHNQIFLKELRNENNIQHEEILDEIKMCKKEMKNIGGTLHKITDIKNLYMTIEQVDTWLKTNTTLSIGLNFFDYEESQFAEDLVRKLSEKVIYVQGKTREEAVYYILFIIRSSGDEKLIDNTLIVNTLENWYKLKNTNIRDSIFIPNFNANDLEIIPGNRNIIVYGEEDFVGNKEPIKLKNRIRENMCEKLRNEGIDDAYEIVADCNGLFSVFKRKVFNGKVSKPRWEEKSGKELIPALLLGKWTEAEGDKEAIQEFSGIEYSEYFESMHEAVGGEDPFILKIKSLGGVFYNIANVEEVWEILFCKISSKDIERFKNIAPRVILSMDPIFELDPSEHFTASLRVEKPKYSLDLKSGIIRSLIMLANYDGKSNNCNISSMQYLVDAVLREVFSKIETEKDWFGISQLLPDMIEASPEVVLSRIEAEIEDENSPFWMLFEKQEDSFTGRNYYTYALWAIEKLLFMKDYVVRAIRVLASLSEREDIKYTLSNKPIATLQKVFCAWMHEIDLTIDEKIQLAEIIVSDYKIGWNLLATILPTRSHDGSYFYMCRPKYRKYFIKEELKYQNQIRDTYKKYVQIGIKFAKDDLLKWAIIFKDCIFFELGLQEDVFRGVNAAIINCQSDDEKYKFKQQIRSTLYNHRLHKNAKWAMKKEYTDKLETEVFNKVNFDNQIYEYLYLFDVHNPKIINPEPYSDAYNFDKEEKDFIELQISEIVKLSKIKDFNLIDLVRRIEDEGNGEIWSIIAEKLFNNEVDVNFLIEVAKSNKISVMKSYIHAVYVKKGNAVIKEILSDDRMKHISVDVKAEILRTVTIDEESLLFIDGCDEELKKSFWKSGVKIKDGSVANQIADRFMKWNNYKSALGVINYYNLEAKRHLDILEKILRNHNDYSLSDNYSYYIEKSFDVIYKEYYPEKKEKNRIIALEIGYLNAFYYEKKIKYLGYTLRTEPEFLAELIKLVFKSSEDKDRIVSPEERHKADVAYHIIYKVKFCPSITDDGILEYKALEKWVEDFLKLVDESKRSAIGRQTLGSCLANSPIGSDGVFPHEAVRKIIERHYSKDLEIGFHIEINNQRGVHAGTKGAEEKKISEKYRRYSDVIKISSPKTSKILLAISDDYVKESESERERAENGL